MRDAEAHVGAAEVGEQGRRRGANVGHVVNLSCHGSTQGCLARGLASSEGLSCGSSRGPEIPTRDGGNRHFDVNDYVGRIPHCPDQCQASPDRPESNGRVSDGSGSPRQGAQGISERARGPEGSELRHRRWRTAGTRRAVRLRQDDPAADDRRPGIDLRRNH